MTTTGEKLTALAERSRNFPAGKYRRPKFFCVQKPMPYLNPLFPSATDLISKIRGLSAKTDKWTEKTRALLGSGKKLSVQDAQDLLEDGEKLKVGSKELNELKSKLADAEDWLNRVSDCVNGQSSLDADAINGLVQEHETLLVELPEEVNELKQAVVGYCLCRRPYEGFMIGCDHCEVSDIGDVCLMADKPLLMFGFLIYNILPYTRSGIMVLALEFRSRKRAGLKSMHAFAVQRRMFLKAVPVELRG